MGQQKACFFETDDLFSFKHIAKDPNMSALSISTSHARLSHVNCETLEKTTNQLVKVLVISGSLPTDECTTCSECKIFTSDKSV